MQHDVVFIYFCHIDQTIDDLSGIEIACLRNNQRNRCGFLQCQSLCDCIRLVAQLFNGFLYLDTGILTHDL